MSLYISSLNSGSNGNCYYVGNKNEAILVDAGISCREITKRMSRQSINIDKVKAIFISHEHSDHIRGVEVLSRKYKIPVYITQQTLAQSNLKLEPELTVFFTPYEKVSVGQIAVLPFPKSHDAADPHSFMVSGNGVNIGVLTDLGHSCDHVKSIFSRCHAVFLEANYDQTMLDEGPYPFYLKKRISSDEGHLSNAQALELFLQHRHQNLQQVILSHLSKENNSPQLVHQLFSKQAGKINVLVASRDYESDLIKINGSAEDIVLNETPAPTAGTQQISMFD